MIVTLSEAATEAEIKALEDHFSSIGWKANHVRTQTSRYIVGIGSSELDIRTIGHMTGVCDVHRVDDAFKLVSRKWKVDPTIIDLGDSVKVGRGNFAIMAGPCSIESEEQVDRTVKFLVNSGVKIMRGGAFKPRSSPYSFRGLGLEGLKMFSHVARNAGIKIITEVLEVAQIEPMYEYVDVYQVGTRNAQNFSLLDELGKTDKPVLIKRGMSGTLEELLQAAEYVFSGGNERILLCERGIRTFEKAYRNTLDLNAVPYLKEKSHLPVVVDPSHGVGVRSFVPAMALASLVTGADGVLVEIHETPEKALSDGAQTLSFLEAADLFRRMKAMNENRAIFDVAVEWKE